MIYFLKKLKVFSLNFHPAENQLFKFCWKNNKPFQKRIVFSLRIYK